MKKACVLLADGFEEVEAVTPIDYLRRAGIEVTIVGVTGAKVNGAHGIGIFVDAVLDHVHGDFDAVIVPGGSNGAKNIAENHIATGLIKAHFSKGKVVAAICAAPAVVLDAACGILEGKKFTCYPGMESGVRGGRFTEGKVVIDGNLITSRGPATAGDFALALVSALAGEASAHNVASGVLMK